MNGAPLFINYGFDNKDEFFNNKKYVIEKFISSGRGCGCRKNYNPEIDKVPMFQGLSKCDKHKCYEVYM